MPDFGFDKLSPRTDKPPQNVWMIQVHQAYWRPPYRIMVFLMTVILVMIWVTESRFQKHHASLGLPENLIIPPSHFEGAAFENQPVGAAIEKKLKADWTINGRYQLESGQVIKVFSSAALSSVQQGLQPEVFRHTPDACWKGAGWERLDEEPDQLTMVLNHHPITFQRRIYRFGNQRELCYFAFLVEGQDAVNQNQFPIAASNRFRREPSLIHGILYFAESVRASFAGLMASFHEQSQTAQFLRCSIDLHESEAQGDHAISRYIDEVFSNRPIQSED
jgi:hypothetical protein